MEAVTGWTRGETTPETEDKNTNEVSASTTQQPASTQWGIKSSLEEEEEEDEEDDDTPVPSMIIHEEEQEDEEEAASTTTTKAQVKLTNNPRSGLTRPTLFPTSPFTSLKESHAQY